MQSPLLIYMPQSPSQMNFMNCSEYLELRNPNDLEIPVIQAR